MAGREPPQANHFSEPSKYVPPVQRQQHSHLQHIAEVSFDTLIFTPRVYRFSYILNMLFR